MEDLFEKLKSEEPINRNFNCARKGPPIDAKLSMQKANKDTKNKEKNENKTIPQKVPTKGEKKFLSNEQHFMIKKFHVPLKKINFDNYRSNFKNIEKVSTKAEKKLFNEDRVPVKHTSATKQKKSSSIENLSNTKKPEARAKLATKRTNDDTNKIAGAKKQNIDTQVKTDTAKNERKRKSTLNTSCLTESTSKKNRKESSVSESKTIVAEKLPDVKKLVVRLQRMNLNKLQKLSVEQNFKKNVSKEVIENLQHDQKEKNVDVPIRQRSKRSETSKVVQKKADKILKQNAKKSRTPTASHSPEVKIKLPITNKKVERKKKLSKLTKIIKPKKRQNMTITSKSKKTNSIAEKNLVKLYGKRTFSLKVRIESCKMLEDMLKTEPPQIKVVKAVKIKKRLNVSFVEEVELIGNVDEKKRISSELHDNAAEGVTSPTVEQNISQIDIMERLEVSSESTRNSTPDQETVANSAMQTEAETLQEEVQEIYETDNNDLNEENPLTENGSFDNENETVGTQKDIAVEENVAPEAEEEEKVVSIEKEVILLNTEEEEVLNKENMQHDIHNEEAADDDDEGENIFANTEKDVINLIEETDCIDASHTHNDNLVQNKICNNGHVHDMDLTSEHSNDGVIKNDVMMNGLDLSNEINKPILENGPALELITSEDEYDVAYSPHSFRSATSDIETHAEKGSETKLSDISDVSEHDNMAFSNPVITENIQVSQVVNVPIFSDPAGLSDTDVALPVADDVSGLLDDIEEISTKGSLEVDKLNATLSLTDGDFTVENCFSSITENVLL